MILTKDNLARRNSNGDTRCSFCHSTETIHHLFFGCFYAKFMWRVVHLMFQISPPLSIEDLFDHWFKLGDNLHNSLLLTATSALYWTIWITQNEVIFDKSRLKTFLQVLFWGTHWLRQWARLQQRDDSWD